MGNYVITLNKYGYDPFIDFIKAYAIVCVLIGHTFPYLNYLGYGLWAGMQVPLFILVQIFHVLKKDNPSFSLKRVLWRIYIPFLIIQTGIFITLTFCNSNIIIKTLIYRFVRGGGIGPGSYFPWIYLQIAVLLPFISQYITKSSLLKSAILSIIICEGCEVVVSLINLPDYIYRLLAIRYLFLFYLGYVLVKKGIIINIKTLTISLLSLATIIYFEYISVDDEPLFFNTAWKFHRWPCYYYVSTLGCYLLYHIYRTIAKIKFLNNTIKFLSKCSYEIFLIQMGVIAIFPSLDIISNEYLRLFIRISSIFLFSIAGGYLFNKYYSKLIGLLNL